MMLLSQLHLLVASAAALSAPVRHGTPPLLRSTAPAARCARCIVASADLADSEATMLLGPVVTEGATAWVETHPSLALPRMCIVATKPPMTDDAITSFLQFLDDSLALDQPFSVFWDMGTTPKCAFPSIKQFRRVIAWLDADGHAETYDARVQGHALFVNNAVLRASIRFMASIARAPQPVKVVGNKETAFNFARDELLEAKVWSK